MTNCPSLASRPSGAPCRTHSRIAEAAARGESAPRRLKLGVAAAVGAASIAVLGATTLGQAQESPAPPKPEVDQVGLTPEPTPVAPGWEVQVGTDANLVAVQWERDNSASYTFEVRNENGEWRQAAATGMFDNGPDPGTQDAVHGATPDTKNVSEPVWVGRNVTGVRVRLDDGVAQDVTLHVIDSTRGKKPDTNVESTSTTATTTTAPAPATTAPPPSDPASGGASGGEGGTTTTTTTESPLQGSGLGQGLAAAALASLAIAFIVRRRRLLAIAVVALVALAACAPTKGGPPQSPTSIPGGIVSRGSWGGDLVWNWGGDGCPNGPEYTHVGDAIVHHTVNSNYYGPGDSVGMIRGIYAYHVYTLGYCDIAYNFIIDNYGTPFEGRIGGIDKAVVGAHSLGANRGTTGIAVLGTFTDIAPSGAAHGTLIDLIRWKFKVHGVNPFDQDAAHIYGHRDVYGTECPGQAFYNILPYTRHYVKAGW